MENTSGSGYFWFFQETNPELVVKVLDGRAFSGSFWVFYGGLTNVEFTLTVTVTGLSKQYTNPAGSFASHGDTTTLASD